MNQCMNDKQFLVIYGGAYRPVQILDAAPFTLFFTWITFGSALYYFGACPPEEYYLSLSRYCIYAFQFTLFLMGRGLYF